MTSGRIGKAAKEKECKLDAPSLAELRRVGNFVQSDDHYVTAINARFLPPVLADFQPLGAPHVMTALKVRTYFDDAKLRGFRNNFELRVEPNEKTGGYKQTYKFGSNRADSKGMFDRDEKSNRLPGPVPNLALLPRDKQTLLCEMYDVAKVSEIDLLPLVRLYSQRLTVEYYPAGDNRKLIEYAQAHVRGQTCTGFTWDLYQAELEMKKGNAAILPAEAQRLKHRFNFLRTGHSSKPTTGFEKLMAQLDTKDDRKYLRDRLQMSDFKVIRAIRFRP